MLNFIDIRSTLSAKLKNGLAVPVHVAAFCGWMTNDQDTTAHSIADAVGFGGQARHPEHIAALGFGAAAKLLTAEQIELLRDELQHLGGRAFFISGRPLRFEVDGIALLGVALGAASSANETVKKWCSQLLHRSATELASDQWQIGLVQLALLALDEEHQPMMPADLTTAAAAKGLGAATRDEREQAWKLSVSLSLHDDGAARDAVRLAVFEHELARLGQVTLARPTRTDLIGLLNGVSRGMKRWTFEQTRRTPQSEIAQWNMENEYHVQNLLWAVLAPVFPDLEDEENLPSLGHKKPRADLGVPSLRTIVEVKFLRERGQRALAKITEEIAADVSLYLSRTDLYDTIVAFVWDDAAQTEQHHELKTGLEALKGVSAAIILSRPSHMR